MPTTAPLIHTADQVTGDWLSEALGRSGLSVESVDRVGTGQLSVTYRVAFREGDGGDPESVVVKLAATDETSRQTGVTLGGYFREVSFYQELAERLGEPIPTCWVAEYDTDEGWFTLLLEDVRGAAQGDQIAGVSVDEARLALTQLARVHAPVLNDPHVGVQEFLNQPNPFNQGFYGALLPGWLERYESRLDAAHVDVARRLAPSIDAWIAAHRAPLGLIHGDYRPDNLLFGDGTCKVVDWQTVAWGPCMTDASYFLGGALTLEDRRAHEEELVRHYHQTLLDGGVTAVDWDTCWDGYRRESFTGILMTVMAPMLVERTDRGDDMFMAWYARAAQQVLDLDALSLLPAEGEDPTVPLVPEVADDSGRHTPGNEPLWNESWYFDACSDQGDLGLYVRTGRVPNQDHALYTACLSVPGGETIMLVDPSAPLPPVEDDAQRIDIDGLRATQQCEEPLKRWHLTLEGRAEAFDSDAAILAGDPGRPVDVSFDLVWQTEGVPYQWRATTRYEIPCHVTGTVRIGDAEPVAFSGVGQRDHSWGSRDWWATDWMWSALHLDDGTRTHIFGIPGIDKIGVGYTQQDGVAAEVGPVVTTHEVAGGDGVVTAGRIVTGDLDLSLEPIAHGPLRLEADDGRLTYFDRAMCRVQAADGRTGVGWVEWNQVQKGTADSA